MACYSVPHLLTTFWGSTLRHWLGARKLGLQKSAYRLAEMLGLIDDAGKMATYGDW